MGLLGVFGTEQLVGLPSRQSGGSPSRTPFFSFLWRSRRAWCPPFRVIYQRSAGDTRATKETEDLRPAGHVRQDSTADRSDRMVRQDMRSRLLIRPKKRPRQQEMNTLGPKQNAAYQASEYSGCAQVNFPILSSTPILLVDGPAGPAARKPANERENLSGEA